MGKKINFENILGIFLAFNILHSIQLYSQYRPAWLTLKCMDSLINIIILLSYPLHIVPFYQSYLTWSTWICYDSLSQTNWVVVICYDHFLNCSEQTVIEWKMLKMSEYFFGLTEYHTSTTTVPRKNVKKKNSFIISAL